MMDTSGSQDQERPSPADIMRPREGRMECVREGTILRSEAADRDPTSLRTLNLRRRQSQSSMSFVKRDLQKNSLEV